MCEQITWFSEVMHQRDVTCWVDSGTLLGLIREQRILPNDTDIDFGMWEKDIPALLEALLFFEENGYRVVKEYYKGQLFKCKIEHRSKRKLIFDINIFRKKKEHAWCPQKFVPPNPYRLIDPRFWLWSCIRLPTCFAWNHLVSATSITALPWRIVSNIRTWWIPSSYFENLQTMPAWNVSVPNHYSDYLTLRYGDWQTPAPQWKFWEQDGALVHKQPPDLLQ